MKTQIKILGTLSLLALAAAAQASVSETDGLGTAWIGTPTFQTASPTTFTTSEGNYGSTGGANGFGALAQTFDLTTSGILQNLQFVFAGTVQVNSIELYDLGAYPASGYPATSATYTPGSLTDLLTAGDQFTYNGGASGAANVAEVTFSGADANITLNAGELYAVQIDPAATSTAYWVRDGQLAVNGQAYRMNQFSSGNMGAINGSIRDFGLAVTVAAVPEPGSLALMGFGGLLSLIAIRRRRN